MAIHLTSFFFFLILTKGMFFIDFRERQRKRERLRDERETSIGCLSPQIKPKPFGARDGTMHPPPLHMVLLLLMVVLDSEARV